MKWWLRYLTNQKKEEAKEEAEEEGGEGIKRLGLAQVLSVPKCSQSLRLAG